MELPHIREHNTQVLNLTIYNTAFVTSKETIIYGCLEFVPKRKRDSANYYILTDIKEKFNVPYVNSYAICEDR